MWLRRMREKGSVTVMLFAAIPIMTAMLLLVVDIGRIALTRTRLQASTDRAAYAGAASLAHSMNGIASSNWRVNKSYRDLRDLFETDSQQDEDAANERISSYESERDAELAKITNIVDGMAATSRAIAHSVFEANTPSASVDIVVESEQSLSSYYEIVDYSYMTGGGLSEPEDVKGDSYEAVSHMIKERSPYTSIGVFATAEVNPLMLGVLQDDPVEVRASSAAQAFGGSIEEFALEETDSLEEAEAMITEEGYDALYRASTVPIWTVGGEGVFH